MRKFVVPSMVSPHSGFDLYDADRVTKDFDLFRVAENLQTRQEVDKAWDEYKATWRP